MSDSFVPFALPSAPAEGSGQKESSDFTSFAGTPKEKRKETADEPDEVKEKEALEEASGEHSVSVERVEGRIQQIRVRCSCGKVMLLDCNYEE